MISFDKAIELMRNKEDIYVLNYNVVAHDYRVYNIIKATIKFVGLSDTIKVDIKDEFNCLEIFREICYDTIAEAKAECDKRNKELGD